MQRSRTLLGLALALALSAVPARAAAPPRAARPPAMPPEDALGAIHDMRLMVLARRALAPLKLGVRVEVRQGIATLSGEVPSAADARQAVATVAAITNVHEVRTDELRTRNGESLAGLSVRVPRQEVRVAKPVVPEVPTRTQATTVSSEGKKPFRPTTLPPAPPAPSRSGERGVEVLPPTARVVSSERRGGEGVGEAVAKLKESDARFRAIPIRVSGGVVVISRRRDADEEAIAALSHALRRVSGVREVRQVNE